MNGITCINYDNINEFENFSGIKILCIVPYKDYDDIHMIFNHYDYHILIGVISQNMVDDAYILYKILPHIGENEINMIINEIPAIIVYVGGMILTIYTNIENLEIFIHKLLININKEINVQI